MISFEGKKYSNWKDYLFEKFKNKLLFEIRQIDTENERTKSYCITSIIANCETEIIFLFSFDLDNFLNIPVNNS